MTIKIYSTKYCADCIRSKAFLDLHQIRYEDFNLEDHPEFIKLVTDFNGGKILTPTIIISRDDGSETIVAEPSDEMLAKAVGLVVE